LRNLRSGLTNGLTNGTGLTNGLGGHRFNRESRRNKWKLYIIPLAAVLLLIIPMISITAPPIEPDSIIIDGEFSDWASISETTSGVEATGFNSNVDIIAMAAENNDDKYLSFHIDIVDNGEIFAGEPVSDAGMVDTFHIFLDTDQDSGTGYSIAGIGVDYMLEMRGWNGEVGGSQILEFAGSDNDDWRGFRATGTTIAEAEGQTVETQIAWSAIDFTEPGPVTVYAHSQSYDGYHDYFDYLVSNSLPILGVTQRSLAPEILSGNGQTLLGFDVKATETDAVLDSIQITFKGTASLSDISAVRLEDASGGTVAETTQLSESISLGMGAITVPAGETQSFTLEVDISSSAEVGRTLGAMISSASGIAVENGVASLVTEPSGHDLGYIDVVPFGVIIDGGFSDWAEASSDDIDESTVGSSYSVDITKYGAYNDGSTLSFFMRTNGNFMEGASVPHAGGIRAPSSEIITPIVGPSSVDSDGDGIFNEHEPGFEHDFDNDGIPDSEDDDKDNDGEIDCDAGGTDEELFNNQTKASKYIGPVDPEPPTNGYDTAMIYVDADNDTTTGYPRSGLGVDYIIEFTGKYGIIKSSSTRQFVGQTQGEWNWTEIGIPEYGHDTKQVEAMLDVQTTTDIAACFETRAWNDANDESDENANAVLVTFGVRADNGYDPLAPSWPVTVYGVVSNTSAPAPDGTWVTIVVKDGGGTPQAWYNTTTTTFGGTQGLFVVSGITVESGWTIELNVSYDWSGTTYTSTNSTTASSDTYYYNMDVDTTSIIPIPEFDEIIMPILIFISLIIMTGRRKHQLSNRASQGSWKQISNTNNNIFKIQEGGENEIQR
ncbi:MAG: hypothetical protein KAS67_06185, partial [Thermoplasmata archaeon]|nr:hypothetical protein [Thermoplasmata archaeon]